MPLERVSASRGLARSAESTMMSGEELVSRIRRTAAPDGASQARLVYASQALLHLKDNEPDERAISAGPLPVSA